MGSVMIVYSSRKRNDTALFASIVMGSPGTVTGPVRVRSCAIANGSTWMTPSIGPPPDCG